MAVLLAILATLQYGWLGEVSQAEKERMRARMQSSAQRFAREFDREMGRAFTLLGPGGPPRARGGTPADRRARWKASALFPDLVRAVFVATPAGDGTLRLSVVVDDTGRLRAVDWPAELAGLRSRLEDPAALAAWTPGPRRGRPFPVADVDAPALVAPVFAVGPSGSDAKEEDILEAKASGYAVVWLSLDVMRRELLPELAARYFADARGLEYRLEVVTSAEPRRVIYRAGPSETGGASERGDYEIGLFGPLRDDELESAGRLPPPGAWAEPPREELPPRPGEAGPDVAGAEALPRPPSQHPWRLLISHPAGSLEAAVASARRRNLAVSFGTLLLLALSTTTLLLSARRAQRLARQQLEFTAGVTHELATPLAGVRSAGQNLADGVVRDTSQVREYGALIEREGRRLTEMVDKVLAFAGMQSGRTAFARHPVAIAQVIEEVLAGARRSLDEQGIRVESDVAADLPEIAGDAPALRHALQNLVGNAAKYAAKGAWIRVRAGMASIRHGREIEVTVEDRGPGIAAEDLPHIFEPFYRGKGRPAGAVAGSGLGLTLVRNVVQAHGGRVSVTTGSGKGTSFTLHLPVPGGGSVR